VESPPDQPKSKHPTPVQDRRRTIKSYPQNLGYNFLGVWTPGNWPVLATGTILTADAALLDDEVNDYFADHPHQTFGDVGRAIGGGVAIAGVTLGLFSAGRIARGGRFRSATYDMSQAVIVNLAYTSLVKVAVGRERPDGSNNLSFFSGHASNAFAISTVFARHYGPKVGIPAYTLASFIAISRMASHAHFFSDVVAGSAFGFGVGRAVVRRNSRPPKDLVEDKPTTVSVAPERGPAGDGAGLRVMIAF